MKRNQVAVTAVDCGVHQPATAKVIGERPRDQPYISISSHTGNTLVVIDAAQMNRLVKKWVKAWGGYPT